MDSTIIQEIANQLGIAVDQAGKFIVDYLPQYAAMKTMQSTASIAMNAVALVFILLVAITAFAVNCKQCRHNNENKDEILEKNGCWQNKERYDFASFYVFLGAVIILVIIIIPFMMGIIVDVQHIIGWYNYPEAMLIDMALKAVS